MDAALVSTSDGLDLALEGDDLVRDEGLVTAVLVSLFSDARKEPDHAADYLTADRRGWWPDREGDRWGSLLWTLARAKVTPRTAERAAGYARESLRWLERDGLAEQVEVTAAFLPPGEAPPGTLRLDVAIARGRGWRHVWRGTAERVAELAGVVVGIHVTGG